MTTEEVLRRGEAMIARPGVPQGSDHRLVVAVADAVDGTLDVELRDRSGAAESAAVPVGEEHGLLERLRGLVGGRRLHGVVAAGVVDRHPAAAVVLRALTRLAREHDAVVVVDALNVAHEDLLLDLVTGRWGADGAPMPRHTRASFERWLGDLGLEVVERDDVIGSPRDEPGTHPALAGSLLDQVLRHVREQCDPWARTRRFVWSCAPRGAAAVVPAPRHAAEEDGRPFLSIVTRTQGGRLQCLAEALTCLAAQTDQDFELLVVGHRLTPDARARVEDLIERQPDQLRVRTRLLGVERGGRSAPLNDGFEAARGRYVVILDDDDLPLAHWVETFRSLEAEAPGHVLRTICVLQDVDNVEVMGRTAVRATGPTRAPHPTSFDMLQHLEGNYTPNTAVAFPAAMFHELGIRFDESLTTTEDWDFLVRAATVVGVASRAEVTCVYRWWTSAESSRTAHRQSEWDANLQTILAKFDSMPILLGHGYAGRVREVLLQRYERSMDVVRLDGEVAYLRDEVERLHRERTERAELLRAVGRVLESRYWLLTAPLRVLSILLGRGSRVRFSDYVDTEPDRLRVVLANLESSSSWRLTSRLRARAIARRASRG